MKRYVEVIRAFGRIGKAYLYKREQLLPTIFSECQRLGGIYIKFLQNLVATEAGSAYLASDPTLIAAFDSAPNEPIELKTLLTRELGLKRTQIASFSSQPLATGSFAQIYAATLINGEDVVIKVLRPSVQQTLRADLRILSVIARLAQPFMRSGLVDLPSFAREFSHTTLAETDYRHEVKMMQYLHGYFANRSDKMVIPRVYEALSTAHIIVEERIHGLPLTEVVTAAEAGHDSAELVSSRLGSSLTEQLAFVGSELLSATLYADYIMCDPHPGNIYLLPDNRVAMIDFGLTAPAPRHRSAFFGMIRQYRALYENTIDYGTLGVAMMAFYDYELYEALEVITDKRQMTSRLQDYISRQLVSDELQHSQLAAKRQISQLFLVGINRDNRFGLKISEDDIILQKAMHNFLSTARLACGPGHRESRYWQIMHTALSTTEAEALRQGVRESSRLGKQMSIEHAYELISDWLSTVAERDQAAYVALTEGGII